MVFLFVLIAFDPILDDFFRIWTNSEIQDGGPRWPPFRNDYTIITSSFHDADVKRDIFRRTMYLPSLVVIAVIFSELRTLIPVVEDQKSPVYKLGLNYLPII